MEIKIVDFPSSARSTRGCAVVIDVFRACSTQCYAIACGAREIVAVSEIETGLELRRKSADSILIGERHGRKLPGCDCGNSPSEVRALDVRDKTVVHTTHAGTQALLSVPANVPVITGSFVNAAAVIAYLKTRNPPSVFLVCSGWEGDKPALEDNLCAELLKARLEGGSERSMEEISLALRSAPSALRFFDPAQTWSPEEDFHLCLRPDIFDFVLEGAERKESSLVLRPVY